MKKELGYKLRYAGDDVAKLGRGYFGEQLVVDITHAFEEMGKKLGDGSEDSTEFWYAAMAGEIAVEVRITAKIPLINEKPPPSPWSEIPFTVYIAGAADVTDLVGEDSE